MGNSLSLLALAGVVAVVQGGWQTWPPALARVEGGGSSSSVRRIGGEGDGKKKQKQSKAPSKAQGSGETSSFPLPRFALPPMDIIAMSNGLERVKDYVRNINPKKSFEKICKDGECRMVEIEQQFADWYASKYPIKSPGNRKDGKKRVLILMSDTGGGHRASAQALDRSLSEQFPGKINVTIMDIWTEHANLPFKNFVPMYRYLAKRPLLWRGFYLYGQFPPTKLFTEVWSWQNSYTSFKNAIINADPDLVVSVHPLCQLMPIWAVEEMNKQRNKKNFPINFVTVVTDLGGAHPTWFDRRVDKVFVPSNAVKRIALKNRIPPEKLVMRGLPIRPSFWKFSKPKSFLRKALGLDKNAKTVLLMGGGDGVGGLSNIAVAIANGLGKGEQQVSGAPSGATVLSPPPHSQLVVICGHNKRLVDQLSSRKYPAGVRVVVKGFVNNVDEFMGASDCLVTKAGPGTIAEAMTRGLPLILSSFLPGQVRSLAKRCQAKRPLLTLPCPVYPTQHNRRLEMFHTSSTAALAFIQEITPARLPKQWFVFSAMTSCSIACRARLFKGVAPPLQLPSLVT